MKKIAIHGPEIRRLKAGSTDFQFQPAPAR
jgi:hypothetical protein